VGIFAHFSISNTLPITDKMSMTHKVLWSELPTACWQDNVRLFLHCIRTSENA